MKKTEITTEEKRLLRKKRRQAKYIGGSILAAQMVVYELFFHFLRIKGWSVDIVFKVLFTLSAGFLIAGLLSLLPKKASNIAMKVFAVFVCAYFVAQVTYSGVFYTYLSFTGTMGVMGQALDFTDVIFRQVLKEWWVYLFYILTAVGICLLPRKWAQLRRYLLGEYLILAAMVLLLSLANHGLMRLSSDGMYSAYDVYKEYTSVDLAVEKLGVWEGMVRDVQTGIKNALGIKGTDTNDFDEDDFEDDFGEDFGADTESGTDSGNEKADDTESIEASAGLGKNENASSEGTSENTEESGDNGEPGEEEPTYPANVLNIDLEALAQKEDDKTIQSLHKYINSVKPTSQNKYTGMFEGYNLIFITAEGFSKWCIDEERTPMLYRLTHEGFVFDNFYSPLWYGSTLGGEYANLTGLMPKNGSYLSMERVGEEKLNMMFTMGLQLAKSDYKVTAYHNNSKTYYGRNKSRPVLGYEWIANGNGLAEEYYDTGKAMWPQSDQFMIDQTFDDFAGDQPFYTYYLTVSGHVVYAYESNAMSRKHWDLVKDLDYSDTTKAYLACQYELELALEELVAKLEEAGIADRTVIALAADHVPYNDKDVEDELAGRELGDTFEWYENAFILWSAGMEETVEVEKVCSSLDILPTLLNLFGCEYDSRMMVGQDILSDAEGIVYFNDRSFITDVCSYNAKTKEIISFSGEPVSDEYLEKKKKQVKNKFKMADNICETDYYSYIAKALGQ